MKNLKLQIFAYIIMATIAFFVADYFKLSLALETLILIFLAGLLYWFFYMRKK